MITHTSKTLRYDTRSQGIRYLTALVKVRNYSNQVRSDSYNLSILPPNKYVSVRRTLSVSALEVLYVIALYKSTFTYFTYYLHEQKHLPVDVKPEAGFPLQELGKYPLYINLQCHQPLSELHVMMYCHHLQLIKIQLYIFSLSIHQWTGRLPIMFLHLLPTPYCQNPLLPVPLLSTSCLGRMYTSELVN